MVLNITHSLKSKNDQRRQFGKTLRLANACADQNIYTYDVTIDLFNLDPTTLDPTKKQFWRQNLMWAPPLTAELRVTQLTPIRSTHVQETETMRNIHRETSLSTFQMCLNAGEMSLWKTGCMDHYNRRKVYLRTGLIWGPPGTMFTKIGGGVARCGQREIWR